MRILLVGEYNRTHKSLQDGLIALGHEVVVVGLTDGFKKIDIDIEIENRFTNGLSKKYRSLVFKLLKIDVYARDVLTQIIDLREELSNYDVVQFVNESSFICPPKTEIQIFDLLVAWNKKAFLLSCGTDHPSVKFAFDKKFRYSILTPYFENRIQKTDFSLGLKYITPDFKKLHDHIYSKIEGVISCDLDYTIPLRDNDKHLGLVPHAINTDEIKYQPIELQDKIVIFHGINRTNYYKKGNDIFESALDIISAKYADNIKILTVENVPYQTYIKAFDDAHILLDQVFAYDQGYNALEAMAKGKVVFTGAEKEWLDNYNLQEDKVAINALPDAKVIAKKLEWLILNPEKLTQISKNARVFVEQEHNHTTCAKKYLEIWNNA